MTTHNLSDEIIAKMPASELKTLKTMIESHKQSIKKLKSVIEEKEAILARRKELDRQARETRIVKASVEAMMDDALKRVKEGHNARSAIEGADLRLLDYNENLVAGYEDEEDENGASLESISLDHGDEDATTLADMLGLNDDGTVVRQNQQRAAQEAALQAYRQSQQQAADTGQAYMQEILRAANQYGIVADPFDFTILGNTVERTRRNRRDR